MRIERYRHRNHIFWEIEEHIRDNLDLIDVIEIEPQTHWIHSERYRIEESFESIKLIPCEKLVISILMESNYPYYLKLLMS